MGGAAFVQLHMRDEQGLGTMDAARFKKTIELIRAHEDCDVVINCTSSGASPEHPATDDTYLLPLPESEESAGID